MALIDKNKVKKPYINDRDEDIFIGLDLPLSKGFSGDGMFASTQTTLKSIQVNLKNLLNTELGERVMQPTLGVKLKRFLFEPFTEDVVQGVQQTIIDTLNYWMPFVEVNDIQVKMSDTLAGDFRSTMEVSIDFSLKKDPTTHESVQVTIGE